MKIINIPKKYEEIGVIKFSGDIDINKIIEEAARYGAHAIIMGDKNILLIRFRNQQNEEEKDEIST